MSTNDNYYKFDGNFNLPGKKKSETGLNFPKIDLPIKPSKKQTASFGMARDEYEMRRASNPSLPEFESYEYYKNREAALKPILDNIANDFEYRSDVNVGIVENYAKGNRYEKDWENKEAARLYNKFKYRDAIIAEYKSVDERLKSFENNGVHYKKNMEIDTASGAAEARAVANRYTAILGAAALSNKEMANAHQGSEDERQKLVYLENMAGKRNVELEKEKAYKYYEKNKDNIYNDNLWGRIAGNFKIGRIGIKTNDAGYASYEASTNDIEAAQVYQALSSRIQKTNEATFINNGFGDNFISVVSQYAPQAVDQFLHKTGGMLVGAFIGAASGVGAGETARIGGSAAVAAYMYRQTAGASYVRLLQESDLSVEDAKKLANSEALSVGAIEFGLDYALSGLWKGVGSATKGATSETSKKVTQALINAGISEKGAKTILVIAKNAGKLTINRLGEGLEEWLQEGVSITADKYAKLGKAPSALELLAKSFDLTQYSTEDFKRMNQSFLAAYIIGFCHNGLNVATSFGINRTISAATDVIDTKVLGTEIVDAGETRIISDAVEIAKKSNSSEVVEAANIVEHAIANHKEIPAEAVGVIVKNALSGSEQANSENNYNPVVLKSNEVSAMTDLQQGSDIYHAVEYGDTEKIISILKSNMNVFENENDIFNTNGYEVSKQNGKNASEKIYNFFKSVGGKAYNRQLGEVELTKSGAKSTVFHGIGKNKIAAAAAIKDVIENGKIVNHEINWKGRGYDTYVIVGKGALKGNPTLMAAVVKVYPKGNLGNRFYLHEIIEIGTKTDTALNNEMTNVNVNVPTTKSITRPNTVVKNNVNYFEEFELSERKKASNEFETEITSPMYAKVQPATREQAQLIKDAQRLGIFVDFFENTSHDYDNTEYNFNGAYRKGHIYINVNSQNPYRVVLSHEATHQIKDTDIESYNKLVEIAKNKLGPDSDFNSLTEDKREEELANVMGDILDNPAKYREVFRQNQGFGQKLLSVVQDMLNKLTGQNTRLDENVSTFTKKLQSVEAELTSVMRDAVGNLKNNTDAKYSGETKKSVIGILDDGRKIYKNNYPDNTPKTVKQSDIVNLVQNVWSKKPIELTLNDGSVIFAQFDPVLEERSDLSKIAYGNRKGSGSEKRITLSLAPDLYEIASDASHTYGKNETGKENPAHNDVTRWEYFVTNLVYEENNGEQVDCYMNIDVKRKPTGDYFYSFAIEKGTAPQTLLAAVSEKTSPTVPHDDIISQDNPIVNTQYMQNTENVTKKSQKTSKLYDNTLQKEWTTEETKAALEENKDRFMYEGITNKETYSSAKSDIESRGVEVVERELFTKGDWGAEDTAKALNLIAQHQSNNEHSKAVDIASVLRERMTKAGQATQALKIVDKLTPEGQMIDFTRNAEKLVNDQVEKHPQKDKIKEELKEARAKDREVERQKKEQADIENIDLPIKPKGKGKVNLPNKPIQATEKSFVDRVYKKYDIKHIDKDTMKMVNDNLHTIAKLNSKDDLINLIIKQSKLRKTVHGKTMIKALNKQEFTYLKDVAVSQIFGMVADKYPVSIAKKLSTTQAMSQLFNAKTMLRNLVSNFIFDAVETVAYDVGYLTDSLLSIITKKKTVGLDKGWFEKGRWHASNKKGRESHIEIGLDLPRSRSGSKYKLDQSGRTFKNDGLMAAGERWLSYGLQTTDERKKAAIENNIRKSFERLKNSGFTQEEIDALVEEEARYKTFQDDNTVSSILTAIKEVLNKGKLGIGEKVHGREVRWTREFGVGDLVQKYTQVPGALITRSVEFSPLGYIKALYAICEAVKSKGMTPQTQRKLALSIARATTGTGLICLFAFLSKKGVFIGEKDDEDKKLKTLQNADGISGMQINTSALGRLCTGESPELKRGDKLLSVGFLEPINTLMALGYNISQTEGESIGDWVGVLDAKLFDQILDIPTMQTARTIMDTINYGGSGVDIAYSVAADAATGFIPSPVRQLGSFLDPVQRYPYNEETSLGKAVERAKASIPFVREGVAAKITPLGDEKSTSTGNRGLDFLNNFINPGNITQYTPSLVSKELHKMSEYDLDVLPKVPAKSFKDGAGVTYEPKGKDYEEYSKLVGKATEESLNKLINSPRYKKMNDAAKAEVLAETVKEAKNIGEDQYILKHGDYKTEGELALTYLSDSMQDKYKTAKKYNISADDFVAAYYAQKDVEGDKNPNTGKTILLTASKNKKKAIDKAVPNLSKKQRQVLYDLFNVSGKVW